MPWPNRPLPKNDSTTGHCLVQSLNQLFPHSLSPFKQKKKKEKASYLIKQLALPAGVFMAPAMDHVKIVLNESKVLLNP